MLRTPASRSEAFTKSDGPRSSNTIGSTDSAIRPATPVPNSTRSSRPVCSKPSAARISSAVPVTSVRSTAAESVAELRVQPVEHLGQQVVELQVGQRGVGDALEAPRDLCRLARISEQPGAVERECHPAGDVLGDGQLPRAERRPLAVAGEQHHPKHPAPRGERHVHRRAHVELPHDLDVLGAAKPLAQHLLGEIRHDLGQAVDEHAPDERRLGIRRIGAEPLGERSLVGAGVGDGGPLEPAVGTGDVDDDEVCQPRGRHPGDALESGVRLDGRRQDLAGLDEQLQPPFAIGLLARSASSATATTPTASPPASTRGPTAACTRIGEPSPRRMSNSPCHARPAAARSPIWRARPTWSLRG